MKYAIELNKAQSERILECACRAQQTVFVQPKSWPAGQSLALQLSSRSEAGLELEGDCDAQIEHTDLLNMYCHAEIDLSDATYFFESHVVSASRREDRLRVVIAGPANIVVQQRRRSNRKAIASSSKVQIVQDHGDTLLTHEGQLYNLSVEGLAFKIPKAEGDSIEIGQTWCVCFEVPEQTHCYKLEAVVRRKLPSSSEDDVILGLEFTRDDHEQLKQLRDFLSARQKAVIQE